MADELKAWMCPSGKHVLGQVLRNGSGVRQLLLYRHAVSNKNKQEVDVMAIVEGYVANVKCDLCERVRTWVPGEEAIQKLLEHERRENKTKGTKEDE